MPACIRMVLAYLGLDKSEQAIGKQIDAKPFGTPNFAVRKLSDWQLLVDYREWSIEELGVALANKRPIIIFVRTGFLEYWQEDFAHAIVIVGLAQDKQFWVHDPGQPHGPIAVSWNGLLAAWAEFSYRGATISSRY